MGKNIIVVDDEPLIAMEIETTLVQAGFNVVGMAQSVEAALKLLDTTEDLHGAVLDANLHDESARPIVERLLQARLPFIIVSGYSADQIGDWAADIELIRKPIVYAELETRLRRLLGKDAP